jgi:hypothetical protein
MTPLAIPWEHCPQCRSYHSVAQPCGCRGLLADPPQGRVRLQEVMLLGLSVLVAAGALWLTWRCVAVSVCR